ncbi:MAG: serine/threonine protein kinase [Lentisphaerae bacterium]|nr:serine/threonine protein kinase [Lentisphaerota bacterium]MCP4103344.1 serine/threonine protein kinase [Lentisphaerota bacterium]
MSTFRFKCPHCNQKLEAEDAMFGSVNVCPNCNEEFQVPDSRLSPGVEIGEYILRECIGSGGMGEVWLAEQQSMGRDVALKIMRAELSQNPDFKKRFQKEIKSSGKMMHTNIVTAFQSGCDNGIYYMAMEYVNGETLEQHLRKGPMTEAEALKVTASVAKALKFAWDKFKIVHRDIKPSNIIISKDGVVKLLDLGISRTFVPGNQMTTLTGAGLLIGTPHYMSPEQAENKPDIDCRADIYTLGIVFCEMLTGRPPFDAPASVEIIAQHIFAPRPDLRLSGASGDASKLAGKMLAVNRNERFADWDEVLTAIKNPKSIKGPALRKRLVPRAVAVLFGCFVALLIFVVAMHLRSTEKQGNEHNNGQPPQRQRFQPPPEGEMRRGMYPPPPRNGEGFRQPQNGRNSEHGDLSGEKEEYRWVRDILVLDDKQLSEVKDVVIKIRLDFQEAKAKFTESDDNNPRILKKQFQQIRNNYMQDFKKILSDEQFRKLKRYEPMILNRLGIERPPKPNGNSPQRNLRNMDGN